MSDTLQTLLILAGVVLVAYRLGHVFGELKEFEWWTKPKRTIGCRRVARRR